MSDFFVKGYAVYIQFFFDDLEELSQGFELART
jgi:hypothetical protein